MKVGQAEFEVGDISGFSKGSIITIGSGAQSETRSIVNIIPADALLQSDSTGTAGTIVIDSGLVNSYPAGTSITLSPCAGVDFDCDAGFDKWKRGWSDEKKMCCCLTQGRACEEAEFDCYAGVDNWKRGWSAEKKSYCCLKSNVGCEASQIDPATGLPSKALQAQWATSPTTPQTQVEPVFGSFENPVNMEAALARAAEAMQSEYVKSLDIAAVVPLAESAPAGATQLRLSSTPNVGAGMKIWIGLNQSGIEETKILVAGGRSLLEMEILETDIVTLDGPLVNSFPLYTLVGLGTHFDCEAGLENAKWGWSEEKKIYCNGKVSDVAFDCTAGVARWQDGWSQQKKTYCCANGGVSCPAGFPKPLRPRPKPLTSSEAMENNIMVVFTLQNVAFNLLSTVDKGDLIDVASKAISATAGVAQKDIAVVLSEGSTKVAATIMVPTLEDDERVKKLLDGPLGDQMLGVVIEEIQSLLDTAKSTALTGSVSSEGLDVKAVTREAGETVVANVPNVSAIATDATNARSDGDPVYNFSGKVVMNSLPNAADILKNSGAGHQPVWAVVLVGCMLATVKTATV